MSIVGCTWIAIHMPNVDHHSRIREARREAWFFNVNAADPDKRAEVLNEVARRFNGARSRRAAAHPAAFAGFGTSNRSSLASRRGMQSKAIE